MREGETVQLGHLPRVELGFWPTPVHFLPRFTEKLGGPDIWIKRDDQSGIAAGGNKARKLEFLLGQAQAEGADVLITTGGPQSNHARMTAASGARLGMEVVLVLRGDDPGERQGNLLLDEVLGARLVFFDGDNEGALEKMKELAAQLHSEGRIPAVVPLGGSVAVGCLGYVSAFLELLEQLYRLGVSLDHLVVAAGSMGTAAGLFLGSQATHSGIEIHLISVSPDASRVREETLRLAQETADLLGWKVDLDDRHLHVYDGYIGEGYAIPTPAGGDAIKSLARTEGIVLDPVYTGKTMSGLVDLVRRGTIPQGDTVLFWHTGGLPGLFAIGLGPE